MRRSSFSVSYNFYKINNRIIKNRFTIIEKLDSRRFFALRGASYG